MGRMYVINGYVINEHYKPMSVVNVIFLPSFNEKRFLKRTSQIVSLRV